MSFGLVELMDGINTYDDMIQMADKVMYNKKALKKGGARRV